MGGQAGERIVFNNLEKAISSDLNQIQDAVDQTLRDFLRRLFSKRSGITPDGDAATNPSGFVGGGFKVRPVSPAAMQVVVKEGLGIQDSSSTVTNLDGIAQVNDQYRSKMMVLGEDQTFDVPAPGGSTRYDIIEVKSDFFTTDAQTRSIWDTGTQSFTPATVPKTASVRLDGRTNQGTGAANADIYYKIGTPGGGDPSTDTGYIRIARIQVDVAATEIDTDRITDERTPLTAGGLMHVTVQATLRSDAAPGSVDEVDAPPGVVVGFVGDGNPVASQMIGAIYILPGAVPANANGSFSLGPQSGSLNSTAATRAATDYIFRITTITYGTLSSGDATDLADVTKTASPISVAPGSPYVKFIVSAPYNDIYSGAVDATDLALTLSATLKW